MQRHSILLLPSFLYNFLLFIVINAIFGERGGKNTHLRHTTLGYCKKKRLHKISRDIRFLLCAGGRIYCHSAKWCNREVEKNCRNCFENKNKKQKTAFLELSSGLLVRSDAFFLCSIQMQRKCLRKIASSDIYTLRMRSWNEISAVVEQQHQQNSLSLMAVTLHTI